MEGVKVLNALGPLCLWQCFPIRKVGSVVRCALLPYWPETKVILSISKRFPEQRLKGLKLYFLGVQWKEENQLEGSLCQHGQTDQSSAEGRDQGIISGVQWIIEGLFDCLSNSMRANSIQGITLTPDNKAYVLTKVEIMMDHMPEL